MTKNKMRRLRRKNIYLNMEHNIINWERSRNYRRNGLHENQYTTMYKPNKEKKQRKHAVGEQLYII